MSSGRLPLAAAIRKANKKNSLRLHVQITQPLNMLYITHNNVFTVLLCPLVGYSLYRESW